ncbi:MAG: ThiS family protein [Chloroflexi bacterium ADurb.Bin180]|nr:MAG: ThiS family protein [Chloroflexi bacterium ADurb.Bin180]
MKVTVKFFSYAILAGTSMSVLELPEGATLAGLTSLLAERFPGVFPQAERAIYLVNHQTGSRDTRLKDGDQILMLQVLGGG